MERLSVQAVEAAIGQPIERWAKRCHEISLAIVRAGLVEGGRVARGTCRGITSQHSWVVAGDPYDPHAEIMDPTLWSYDATVTGIWYGTGHDRPHVPHGTGSIWQWGRPDSAAEIGEQPLALTPSEPLSKAARDFLDLLGPLGATGWRTLAHAPVGGWPAGEIFAAMLDTEDLGPLIPIDVAAMTTGRNLQNLYA